METYNQLRKLAILKDVATTIAISVIGVIAMRDWLGSMPFYITMGIALVMLIGVPLIALDPIVRWSRRQEKREIKRTWQVYDIPKRRVDYGYKINR